MHVENITDERLHRRVHSPVHAGNIYVYPYREWYNLGTFLNILTNSGTRRIPSQRVINKTRAMRQRILGLHTPPCHRRMVITIQFNVSPRCTTTLLGSVPLQVVYKTRGRGGGGQTIALKWVNFQKLYVQNMDKPQFCKNSRGMD